MFESLASEIKATSEEYSSLGGMDRPRQAVFAALWDEMDINDGGFDQFYLNSSGDAASRLPDYLDKLGLHKFSGLVLAANAALPGGSLPVDRSARVARLHDLPHSKLNKWID